jgi:hypothetical protein
MGLFKDNITGWFSPVATDGKYDLNSLSKSIRLLIDVNNSEQSTYTGYLIALFSIFVPIYIALFEFNTSILIYMIVIEINAIGLIFLLRKIKEIKKCNEMMIEQYNYMQSELGGSFLVKLQGKKEDVIKQVNEWNKRYNFKPFIKSHDITNNKEK